MADPTKWNPNNGIEKEREKKEHQQYVTETLLP